MDDGEGGRAALNFDEKSFLFEWLVENDKTLAGGSGAPHREPEASLAAGTGKGRRRRPDDGPLQPLVPAAPPRGELSRARRASSSLSCLFIDLDDFDPVNDQYSHFIGNKESPGHLADLLRGACRREDVLVRFGADEFARSAARGNGRAESGKDGGRAYPGPASKRIRVRGTGSHPLRQASG